MQHMQYIIIYTMNLLYIINTYHIITYNTYLYTRNQNGQTGYPCRKTQVTVIGKLEGTIEQN